MSFPYLPPNSLMYRLLLSFKFMASCSLISFNKTDTFINGRKVAPMPVKSHKKQ